MPSICTPSISSSSSCSRHSCSDFTHPRPLFANATTTAATGSGSSSWWGWNTMQNSAAQMCAQDIVMKVLKVREWGRLGNRRHAQAAPHTWRLD